MWAAQDRQRIKAQGPTMTDLLHKHVVRTVDKEGNNLRTEYNFVPADVLGNVGYHAEPNWCARALQALALKPRAICRQRPGSLVSRASTRQLKGACHGCFRLTGPAAPA